MSGRIIPANTDRIISGALETATRNAKAPRGVDSPLAGPIFTDRFAPKVPRKMQTGSGAPSLCWVCGRQLQRAKGKGLGLFYFNVVRDQIGVEHRVHGFPCTQDAIDDGGKVITPEKGNKS